MKRRKVGWESTFVLACAVAAATCSGGSSPASPSALSAAPGVNSGGGRIRALDDPPPPDVSATPPAPVSVAIRIVGTSGTLSYDPNPAAAAVGNMLVWTNNDAIKHHIVIDRTSDAIDDSIDLGDLDPGASTAPVALTNATAQYHCLIHPSMKGGINQAPPPDVYVPPAGPDPYMPPGDGYYGYRQRSIKR